MESLDLLLGGFAIALTPTNLGFAFAGCMLGTMVGVLPGFGPSAGTAVLVPMTFALDPTSAIIMLAAIYYGAMYGGTITSVLLNTPGEAASAITCLDGYQMQREAFRSGLAIAGDRVVCRWSLPPCLAWCWCLAVARLPCTSAEEFSRSCARTELVPVWPAVSLRGLVSAVH